ncbi:MAG TPA: ribosomal protein S18-alanine N-acetyltransferase [Epulopiscium sp.]|nr:ribosomal protein S18-alanine N-acetyltransferase [Candidatus Epulonipiscium sp.]
MISILPFTREHIAEVCILEKTAFSDPWSEMTFIKELENPQAYYFIAIKDEKIVGYAGMLVILDEGHIMNIAVDKTQRGTGIGKELVKKIIEKAQELEMMGLTLEVRVGNIAAIKLYESFGFVSVGERKNYYQYPNEDATIMWCFFE